MIMPRRDGIGPSLSTHHASVIKCRGIEKRYGGIHALKGVDLTLTAGRVHGLIGPNGAGKSTLVKILVGAERADVGSISIDDVEVNYSTPESALRHGVALMPQELSIVSTMSVVENVTLGSEVGVWGIRSRRRCADAATAVLALLDIDVPPNIDVEGLSGAYKRLIMMARALHKGAQCIVLDEPTAGLHPNEMGLVRRAISRLSSEWGVTILLVSHHLSEVAELCEEVVCIGAGREVAHLRRGEVTADALITTMHGAVDSAASPRSPDAPISSYDDDRRDCEETELSISDAASGGASSVRSLSLKKVSGARLDDVSIHAEIGEVVGVTGLLGSGMSDVADLLLGAEQPREGKLMINGRECQLGGPDAAARSGIGYTSGERARIAFPNLSIRWNTSISALSQWFGAFGLTRRSREHRKVRATLEQFELPDRDRLDLSSLSGGNQQRVLLARLLAAQFRVLILDEPTVGVDIVARESIWSVVRDLRGDHVVIVISGENDELMAMCDRVYCIRGGKISAELTGEKLTSRCITEAII